MQHALQVRITNYECDNSFVPAIDLLVAKLTNMSRVPSSGAGDSGAQNHSGLGNVK